MLGEGGGREDQPLVAFVRPARPRATSGPHGTKGVLYKAAAAVVCQSSGTVDFFASLSVCVCVRVCSPHESRAGSPSLALPPPPSAMTIYVQALASSHLAAQLTRVLVPQALTGTCRHRAPFSPCQPACLSLALLLSLSPALLPLSDTRHRRPQRASPQENASSLRPFPASVKSPVSTTQPRASDVPRLALKASIIPEAAHLQFKS